MADETTQKRKRHSKNKKKYWKKHAPIADVEDFLEDQRLQERTGGIVAEKADADIFFVDSTAAEITELPVKRRKKQQKQLKCHSALLPNPRIKPIKILHNVKKHKTLKEDVDAKYLAKIEESPPVQDNTPATHRTKINHKEATFDLWNVQEEKLLSPANGDVAPNEHYLRIMKQTRKKTPIRYRNKPSLLPAVEVAHPGASYNPEYYDHQDLLGKAFVVELDKEKRQQKIVRALDEMFPSGKDAPTEKSKTAELAEGLFDESSSESEAEEDKEIGTMFVNPPVRRENKKTETTRKKEAKQRAEKEAAEKAKAERIRKNQVFRINSKKKEVKEILQRQLERQNRKRKRQEEDKMKPKVLGKNKFEAPDMELKLSEEIEGSLRLLKPEGHLLEDRFKSLQKRNMIEPRSRAKKTRKYKRKRFTKTSHKDVV